MANIEKIEINTPFIKLDSLLKFAGLAPDGAVAKQLILSGGVLVNGEVCTMRGKKMYPGDTADVNGVVIEVVCAE